MLGVILARGGSKGLPGKNTRLLLNKPLIVHSIEHALNSKNISKLIVSTDDEQIAQIALAAGAEVPFLRPPQLASDTASSIDAILHAIDFCESEKEIYTHIALLEPTSPLRTPNDIDLAYEQLVNTPGATAIVSMAQAVSTHPEFMYNVDVERFINKKFDGLSVLRRQDTDDIYYPEGTIYISEVEELKAHKTFYHPKTIAYIVDKWKSFEIDDLEDFLIVQAIMQAYHNGDFNNSLS